MAPETRYARNGDVSIAFQVFGDGPFDVVISLPASSHVELAWEAPMMRAYFERLASFARVISFDKRGVGLSDKSAGYSSPETRMDDIKAVMDCRRLRARRRHRLVRGRAAQPPLRRDVSRSCLGACRLRRPRGTEPEPGGEGACSCRSGPPSAPSVSAIR